MRGQPLPIEDTPKYLLAFKELEVIFFGGCGLGLEFITQGYPAFAHCHIFDDGMGWICVPNKTRLRNRMIMLHEVAHIIAKSNHTDKWRKVLLSIGGTLDPIKVGKEMTRSYHKKQSNKYVK